MIMNDEVLAKLERDIAGKLRATQGLIAQSEGAFIIKVIPKGSGFDIKLTITS